MDILRKKLSGEKNGESGGQNLPLDREPKYITKYTDVVAFVLAVETCQIL